LDFPESASLFLDSVKRSPVFPLVLGGERFAFWIPIVCEFRILIESKFSSGLRFAA
jgi:hypothetical protein